MNREPIYNTRRQHCGFMGAQWSGGVDGAWRLANVPTITAEHLQELYGLEWVDYVEDLDR